MATVAKMIGNNLHAMSAEFRGDMTVYALLKDMVDYSDLVGKTFANDRVERTREELIADFEKKLKGYAAMSVSDSDTLALVDDVIELCVDV